MSFGGQRRSICFQLTLFLLSFQIKKSYQACSLNKILQGANFIFSFECYAPEDVNSPLPYQFGSAPTEFNYLDLSPNLYTDISTFDLCQFSNIHTLDISSNQLFTIVSVFEAITCFNVIQNLIANNNQISTPLLG
jgi:hypothetical protein